MSETSAENAGKSDGFVEQVKAELEKIVNPRKSLLQKIGVLLFSLLVFASLGFFKSLCPESSSLWL